MSLKKWHQHPGRPDALWEAIGQLADAAGFRGSSRRLDVPDLCAACRCAGIDGWPSRWHAALRLAASWPG